jgi:NodT family efflux transporter outer membrane factor (OMF) lipoprotein
VYYGDIKGNSKQLDAASLEKPHAYKVPTYVSATSHQNWWDKFHDPQLNQLIKTALSDSPSMKIAETRVRQAQRLAEEVGAALWPSLDLSGYIQRQRFSARGLAPPPFNGQTFNIATLGLNFNYEVDFWGKNRAALRAKLSEKYAADAEQDEAKLIISTAVANTYFQLCYTISQVKLAKERLKISQQLYQISSDRHKHGINSEIPIKSLQNNLQQSKQTLLRYQQSEALSRHQLAVLLGKNPFRTDIKTKPFVFHRYHVSLPASLPANLIASRPDLEAAKRRVEAACSEVNVSKARFFPNINLSGLFSYQEVGKNLGHFFQPSLQNNAITAALDLPIFDAGERRADLGVKYAEFDLAVNEYNQTILKALQEVADQVSNQRSLSAQLESQYIAVNATKQNYQLYRLRYDHGISDYAELLQRKDLFLKQESNELALQTRHIQTIVATIKALGGKDG